MSTSRRRQLATIDPDEHFDYQANRPTVALVDGVTRGITWPTIEFQATATPGHRRPAAALRARSRTCTGKGLCDTVLEVAHQTGLPHGRDVRRAPRRHAAPPPGARLRQHHRRRRHGAPRARAVPLRGPDRHRRRAARHGAEGRAWPRRPSGRRCPHYVADSAEPASPPGPCSSAFAVFSGWSLDLRELGVAGEAWRARVDSAIEDDDEMRAYVRALEEQSAERRGRRAHRAREIPSGDDLAEAFEEYLREQGLEERLPVSRSAGRRTPRRSRATGRSTGRGCPGRPARRCRGTSWRSPRTRASC